jgi:thiol-disulfide isomerase/thioredoxin
VNRLGFLALFLCAAGWTSARGALVPLDEAGLTKLLQAHKGKVVLINFWATWCAPCRAEMPQLVKMEAAMRDRGLRLITVSADEPEQESDAARFLEKTGVSAPHYIKRAKDDDRFITAVDAKWGGALPATFLYDRKGNKVRSFVGEVSLTELEAAVRKLL